MSLADLLDDPELAATVRDGRCCIFNMARSNAAERARRYRERQARGVQVVEIEVPIGWTDILLQRGLIGPEDIESRCALALALYLLIEEKLEQ